MFHSGIVRFLSRRSPNKHGRINRLKKAHIIPDTLDDFKPSCYLSVFYNSSGEKVFLGNKLKPSYTKEAPKARIWCAKSEAEAHPKGYTIALTDPDAPSRKDPKWSEICHWIAIVATNGTTNDFYLDNQHQAVKDIVECKRRLAAATYQLKSLLTQF